MLSFLFPVLINIYKFTLINRIGTINVYAFTYRNTYLPNTYMQCALVNLDFISI